MNAIAPAYMAMGVGCALAVGALATWGVARSTEKLGWLDEPNARSAHATPTPTAGGLGVIAGFWAGMAALWWGGGWSGEGLVGWLGASVLLLLTLVDDVVRPLRPWEKMLLILLAVAVWLAIGPGLQWLVVPGLDRIELGGWGWLLTALWFVGLCNVFNFMDGIDGLGGAQTCCACFWAGLLLWGLGSPAALAAWVLAAAAAGFLVFNAPPARIFMGDVGALFIGFSVAACGVLGARAGLPLWVFGALLVVYLFDVGYTLVRRALRGERLSQGHRKHLYQRLDKLGWSHARIDAVAVCITSIMGWGAYAHMGGEMIGCVLFLLGVLLLVAGAVWIETRDPDFD